MLNSKLEQLQNAIENGQKGESKKKEEEEEIKNEEGDLFANNLNNPTPNKKKSKSQISSER
jgi:hypothetical protein